MAGYTYYVAYKRTRTFVAPLETIPWNLLAVGNDENDLDSVDGGRAVWDGDCVVGICPSRGSLTATVFRKIWGIWRLREYFIAVRERGRCRVYMVFIVSAELWESEVWIFGKFEQFLEVTVDWLDKFSAVQLIFYLVLPFVFW